jgi:hypothetical protein
MSDRVSDVLDEAVIAAEHTVREAIHTTDDDLAERILELAALPKLDYERQRRTAANELGMRVTQLDAAVRAARQASGDEQLRASQRDALVGIAVGSGELWRDDSDDALATVHVDGHREHHRVRGLSFRRWLVREYGNRFQFDGPNGERLPSAPGGQALTEALNTIEAIASRGPLGTPKLRVGGEVSLAIYLDLCNDEWTAVEIDAQGWRIVRDPPVQLIRAPGMLPLPNPVRGDGLAKLKACLRLEPSLFVLVVGWLVGTLRPRGPYPLLAIHGEQGTGKTTLVRMLRRLVDPNRAGDRSPPRDERDLVIAASNSWLCAYDNLSRLDEALSDAMCRIATGAGFGTRTLYSNADETLFQVCRPQLVNGIPDLARSGDLIDRAIMIELPQRDPEELAFEDDLWSVFEEALPEMLGLLLDAVSTAMRRLPEVKLYERPRLADFARWVEAAAPALGWAPGEFLTAYLENRMNAARVAIEADAVASVILRMVENGRFNGTAEALLARLNMIATDDEKRAPGWPKTAHRLGNAVKRAAPALRRADIVVTSTRTKHARMILIEGGAKMPSPLSPLSPRPVFGGPGDSGDNDDSRFGPPSTSAARGYSAEIEL